jgi:hypothetical protein
VIVRILPQAEEELYQAVVWYEDREFGVGLQLVEAYELARLVIEERADRLPRLETLRTERDIRRVFLQRFPFMVVFEVMPRRGRHPRHRTLQSEAKLLGATRHLGAAGHSVNEAVNLTRSRWRFKVLGC